MKVKVTRRLMALLLSTILAFTLFGCGSSSPSTPDTAPEDTEGEKEATDVDADTTDTIKIGYLNKTMAIQWSQDVVDALEQLGKEQNFELVYADADFSPEAQLEQLNTFINNDVDGIICMVADEGMASAVVETANEAGIPVVGESLRMEDENDLLITPCVELDAAKCGAMNMDWVSENWESTGVDLSDETQIGFIQIIDSQLANEIVRGEGAYNEFKVLFPNVPEKNCFIADIAADSAELSEAAYNQVSTIFSANTAITTWVLCGVMEDYALGACRAIEDIGYVDSAILTSIGGERAIQEWEGGTKAPWYCANYYTGMDAAKLCADGLLQIVRDGKIEEEIWPEYIDDGETYASAKFSGTIITYDNYKDIVK